MLDLEPIDKHLDRPDSVLLDYSPPLNDANYDRDEGNYQQEVNETASNRVEEEPQQPHDHEDEGDGPKHDRLQCFCEPEDLTECAVQLAFGSGLFLFLFDLDGRDRALTEPYRMR